MTAIILAAGYATRMYPLTENTPKPLLPFRGSTIIDIIIDQINALPDIREIVVVTNDKFYPHFREWAEKRNARNPAPLTVLNDGTTSNETRRGAVGDVAFAIDEREIDDELLVIAGDNYSTYDLAEQLEVFRKTRCDTLCGKEFDDMEAIKAFAVAVLDADGKILDLEEKPQNPKSNIAIYATYFFRRETAALFSRYIAEGNNPDNIGSFPQWLSQSRDIYVYKVNGEVYDIGTIETYRKMM